jgi:hypothetical protein
MEKSARKKEPKLSGSRSEKRSKAATEKMATKMPIAAKALITAGTVRTQSIIKAIAELPAPPSCLHDVPERMNRFQQGPVQSRQCICICTYIEERVRKMGLGAGEEEREKEGKSE